VELMPEKGRYRLRAFALWTALEYQGLDQKLTGVEKARVVKEILV
jgi:hypothetical protein